MFTYIHTLTLLGGRYLLFFHGNNGYTNKPHCYVILTLLVLLYICNVLQRVRDIFLNAVYDFSCISICERPDYGSQIRNM